MELFLKGIGQKTIKQFEMMNTTEAASEIGLVTKVPHQTIACETLIAMISSERA
jgi:hypothetical protein